MKSKRLILALAISAIVLSAASANATAITYEISGVASGTIGATTFTNASVEETGIGDTANVTSLFGGLIFGNPFSTLTVTIGGVGTATVTDASEIWAIPAPSGLSPVPVVVIGRVDKPPPFGSNNRVGVFGRSGLSR